MNWQEYVPLAMRTASPREPELHGWMGLVSEAGELVDAMKKVWIYGKELDKINFQEELGDCLWYVAFECQRLGFDTLKFVPYDSPMQRQVRDLAYYCATYDGAGVDMKRPWLECIMGRVIGLHRELGLKLEDTLDMNIRKLAKRYGDKYSDQAALIRDLKAEVTAMEQGCGQTS